MKSLTASEARYLQILHTGDDCGCQPHTILDSCHPGPLRVPRKPYKDAQADETDHNNSYRGDEDYANSVVQHPSSQSNLDHAPQISCRDLKPILIRSISVLINVNAALSSPVPMRAFVALMKVSVTSIDITIVRIRWWKYLHYGISNTIHADDSLVRLFLTIPVERRGDSNP